MNSGAIDKTATRRAGWIAFLTSGTILGSFIFACATPFPALAALAALYMNKRDAVLLIVLNWACNQAIGYGFLHYPWTWESFAWVATVAAAGAEVLARGMPWAAVAVFIGAVAAYEGTLYAATAFLPSGEGAFGAKVVLYIVTVNAVAFLVLLACQGMGRAAGVVATREQEMVKAA
jgi:hypothetical protein